MKNLSWNLAYFEKSKHESHINIFRSLEIENYLNQSLKKQGFNLLRCKLNFSTTRITIFLSIYEKARTQNKNKKWKQLSARLFQEQRNKKQRKQESNCSFCFKKFKNGDSLEIDQQAPLLKIGKKVITDNIQYKLVHSHCYNIKTRMQRQRSTRNINNEIRTVKKITIDGMQFRLIYRQKVDNCKKKITKNFFKNILQSIKQLTENKFQIILKAQLLNEKFFQTNLKLSLLELEHKFKNSEMKVLYLAMITQKDTANLLSSYLSKEIRTTRRHNYFLNSLLQNLTLIMKQKHSKIKGIKIILKGRLNNAPRSRKRIIKLGKIPIIKQNMENNYSEAISITRNGTIGIKVWVN